MTSAAAQNTTTTTATITTTTTIATASSSSSLASDQLDDCVLAQNAVLDPWYNAVRCGHVVCGLVISGLLCALIRRCRQMPIPLHPNLKILLINVLICYIIFAWSYLLTSARFLILYFIHTDACQCLTPVWLAYLLRMPAYVYLIASPLFHFAIMVERIRATLFVRNYERDGVRCGVFGVCVVWTVTALFSLYIVCTSLADTVTYSKPLVYISMTTAYNAQVFINIHYFFLFLVVCISLADYLLIRINRLLIRRNRLTSSSNSQHQHFYNLSQTYQTNENIATMRVIFPLDLSYTLFFTVFILASGAVRIERPQIGQLAYMYAYEGIQLILSLHAIITLWAYLYFLARQRARIQKAQQRRRRQPNAEEEARQYFRHLQSLWAENRAQSN